MRAGKKLPGRLYGVVAFSLGRLPEVWDGGVTVTWPAFGECAAMRETLWDVPVAAPFSLSYCRSIAGDGPEVSLEHVRAI